MTLFSGYCPQFDGLLDNLTGRETLRIYCLLRGIPDESGARAAAALVRELGFTKHYDKKVQTFISNISYEIDLNYRI